MEEFLQSTLYLISQDFTKRGLNIYIYIYMYVCIYKPKSWKGEKKSVVCGWKAVNNSH